MITKRKTIKALRDTQNKYWELAAKAHDLKGDFDVYAVLDELDAQFHALSLDYLAHYGIVAGMEIPITEVVWKRLPILAPENNPVNNFSHIFKVTVSGAQAIVLDSGDYWKTVNINLWRARKPDAPTDLAAWSLPFKLVKKIVDAERTA